MGTMGRGAALLAAVCVLAAGCAGGGEPMAEEPTEPLIRRTFDDDEDASPDEGAGATSDGVAGDQLAPWPEPLATPVAADDGPELEEVTGRDWEQVVQGLLDLRSEAYERRDVELTRLYATEECGCQDVTARNLEAMRSHDLRRVSDARQTLAGLTFVAEERGIVTLDVTIDSPRAEAVDAEGRVVEVKPPVTLLEKWTLVSTGADDRGPWRVAIVAPRDGGVVS